MEIDSDSFMMKAFGMALSKMGETSPNPPVGAIIVKDGAVVSSGGTLACGGDHAEICALSAAGSSARGADLFVTLEPCCHYGKTPPCTDAIIKSGIKRVFIPILDPNPLVSGNGVKALRDAGIDVTLCSKFENYANQIMGPFFTRIKKSRPHVLYKTAMTADGFTSTAKGDSKWISGSMSRYAVHRLRSIVDAVIVGKNTCAKDDPALTCRLEEFSPDVAVYFKDHEISMLGCDNIFMRYILSKDYDHESHDPLRVIIGMPDNLNNDMKILNDNNLVIFEKESVIKNYVNRKIVDIMKEKNVLCIVGDSSDIIDFAMNHLYNRGIMFSMLEGGATLCSSFFRNKCIDEYLAFIAPKMLGGGRGVFCGNALDFIKDAPAIRDVTVGLISDDLLYHGYL